MLTHCQMLLSAVNGAIQTDKARAIQSNFIRQWREKLGNWKLILECDPEETLYLTRPEDAVQIQTRIRDDLSTPLLNIVDAFACIGGDSIAAMYVHRGAQIHAVQRTASIAERHRFQRLQNNLAAVSRCLFRRTDVHCYDQDIRRFWLVFRLTYRFCFWIHPGCWRRVLMQ